MSSVLQYTVKAAAIYVSGNTFPHKELLKNLGGSWNPEEKAWKFRENSIDVVRQSVEDAIQDNMARLAAEQKQARKEAKEKKIWEASPEGKKARVLAALKDRSNSYWICCENCEVIDWTRKTTYCQAHAVGDNAFRVRGCIFDGT
jgi:hypothetical protein